MTDLPPPTSAALIFQFPFPKAKKISFQSIFRTEDPATKDNLSRTTTIRDELVNGKQLLMITIRIALDGGNASACIASLERYLPQLFGLVVSVEDNQKLRLNSPLSMNTSHVVTHSISILVDSGIRQ